MPTPKAPVPPPDAAPLRPRRRQAAITLLAAPWAWTGASAQPAQRLRATPRQTEGPFYPVALPADTDHDLLKNGALRYSGGTPAWVEGTVTDLQGRPLAGAQVEIWQCDQAGHYHHPQDGDRADPAFQGFGRVTLGHDGASETDGLEVTSANLGGPWSQGLLVVQDGRKRMPESTQNFKLVPWADIARALGLE